MVSSVPLCGSSHKVVYSFQFWMQRVLLRSKIAINSLMRSSP